MIDWRGQIEQVVQVVLQGERPNAKTVLSY